MLSIMGHNISVMHSVEQTVLNDVRILKQDISSMILVLCLVLNGNGYEARKNSLFLFLYSFFLAMNVHK